MGKCTQITVKRLTSGNILGSEIPSGIKVSFENIASEIMGKCTIRHLFWYNGFQ